MANKVIEDNEIYLGGTYYPLNRPVQSVLASIYPAKVTIGDTTRDSNLRSSIISWSDWRGGIGVERMQGPSDADRAWYSTCNLRHRHHLVLAADSEATRNQDADGAAIGGSVTFIQNLGNDLYACWNRDPYYYVEENPAASAIGSQDSWTRVTSGGDDYSFPGDPNHSITVRMGGTDYIIVGHTDGYSYFSGATAVSDVKYSVDSSLTSENTKFFTFWDERLWGIDVNGQLWYTLTLGGVKVDDAKLPVESDNVTNLFIGRDAAGEQIIYAATKTGLYAHDFANQRWVETQFQLPFHRFNGSGSVRWRDSIYMPSGLGIYKYINGSNNAVITVMGPDRDDGVPKEYRGTIKKLVGTHTELLAAIDATTAPGAQATTDIPRQGGATQGSSARGIVIQQGSGQSSIVAWNDTGWETKWTAPTADAGYAIEQMVISNAGKGEYRLWWAFRGKVYTQLIPFDVTNPSQLSASDGTDYSYEASGTHETPWFDAQQTEVDKLAIKLKVEVQNASANETVIVEYALNYSETYETALTTITSTTLGATSGTQTFLLPNPASPVGVSFRAIKFRLTLARGSSDTSKSPDVVSLTLEYRKKLEAKYGHTVEVDLNKTYKGKDAQQLRNALVTSIESNTLQEFTFRDDGGGTRNYYVDVTSATGIEYTGYDERGSSRITLVEP